MEENRNESGQNDGFAGRDGSVHLHDGGDLQSQVLREGTELTPQVLDLLAHSCVANLAIARMEARGWEAVTGQGGFQPLKGFSVVGLEWSVVVNGNCGVVVRIAMSTMKRRSKPCRQPEERICR